MTEHDHVVDLADRMQAKYRRGEDLDFEFEIEWGSFTTDEQKQLLALIEQRRAHKEEVAAALTENVRILKLLVALQGGAITALEFVERVRGAVPDPLVPE